MNTDVSAPVIAALASCEGLSVDELCAHLTRWLDGARIAEWVACRLLAELADRFERGAPELRAYSDVYRFARLRFDMGVRRARERVRIGRALRGLPELSRAFFEGRLGYARVREVTRVATRADELLWLDLALALPLRVLERRIADVAGSGADRQAAKAAEPATARWTSGNTVGLRVELPATAWALLERAMEEVRRRSEATLSDGEALEAVAREAMARSVDEGDRCDVRRMVVLYACSLCRRTEVETGAGPVELDVSAAQRLACGAPRVDLETEGRSVTVGGEIPAAVRRAVLLRDRMRCRAPGCARRRYVDVHHLRPRELGGEHSRSNCVTLCTGCHQRVHDGWLAGEGDADGELAFRDARAEVLGTRGVTPGGRQSGASDDAATVLDIMSGRGGWFHPDEIVEASGLPVSTVLAALTELELVGKVGLGSRGYAAAAS